MDLILTAHKMRIYPNDEQIKIIETTFGATRKMFNSLHAQFLERSKMSDVEFIPSREYYPGISNERIYSVMNKC